MNCYWIHSFLRVNIDGKSIWNLLLRIKIYAILWLTRKGVINMLAIKPQITTETPDSAKLELYRLIGDGYKAMQEGRTSTIEEVREKLEKRRKERG